MTSTLRPDEKASLAEIEKSKEFDKKLKKGLGTAITLGTTALSAGTGLASKVMPFLNDLIPSDLALKGINKVSPKIGSFLKKGMEQGLNVKDGFDFIKENISKANQQAPDQRNIVQKYSDKLHEFVDSNIKKGLNPAQVASLAEILPQYKKDIDKIVKDYKTPFMNIVESIYGSPQQAKASQGQPMQDQQKTQQGQSGQGQQALQAILQQINQRLGG